MSTSASSPQQTDPALRQAEPALRRASWPGAGLRVSDVERSAVADRLGQHFSDGRLDEAEFGDRLDRAMRATTMADLTGLLSDLPDGPPTQPEVPAGGRRQRRKLAQVQLERERLRLKHEQRHHRLAERQQRAHAFRWIPMFVLVAVVTIIVLHTLTRSVGVWLVLGLIAFLWLRRNNSGYRGS